MSCPQSRSAARSIEKGHRLINVNLELPLTPVLKTFKTSMCGKNAVKVPAVVLCGRYLRSCRRFIVAEAVYPSHRWYRSASGRVLL